MDGTAFSGADASTKDHARGRWRHDLLSLLQRRRSVLLRLFEALAPMLCVPVACWLWRSIGSSFWLRAIDAGTTEWAQAISLFVPFVMHSFTPLRPSPRELRPRDVALRYSVFAALTLVSAWLLGARSLPVYAWLLLWLSVGYLSVVALHLAALRSAQRETVAIIGAGPAADRLVDEIRRHSRHGVRIIGVFDDRADRSNGTLRPKGSVPRLLELGRRYAIDWIVIAMPDTTERRIEQLLQKLKSLSVRVAWSPSQAQLKTIPRAKLKYIAGTFPVTVLAEPPIRRWGAAAKGLEDYLLGGLLALGLLPLMLAIALAIRIESPGPVLFRQRRHAWNNGEFDVLKFRSMRWAPRTGGQAPLDQTRRDDERITRLGRFLRRSSLDELPQLFNVLRGEMSLVGPRPHAVNMRTEDRPCEDIVETYAHRHRVKPGVTGWAQVNGFRGATHTVEQLRKRIELDLDYIERWSIWLDIKILLLTVWAVIRGRNAY